MTTIKRPSKINCRCFARKGDFFLYGIRNCPSNIITLLELYSLYLHKKTF